MSSAGQPERLLLDAMFAPRLAELLCAESFDVCAVAGDPVLARATDVEIAAWCLEHDRRVVTENVRDFAPLVASGEPGLRVLFTSVRRCPRSRKSPGPLLAGLRRWLADQRPRADVDWVR